jgi:uncharacterized protein YecE (DUF72 family)
MGANYGPPQVFVGCCGWQQARARYFAEFPVVELQDTFYQPPSLELAQKWRREAPADFRFSLKAWQLITHPASSPTYRRLKEPMARDQLQACGFFRRTDEVAAAWQRTLAVARTLQAEAIVFKCPASFTETQENLANLEAFFRTAEREQHIFAWEPRGPWPLFAPSAKSWTSCTASIRSRQSRRRAAQCTSDCTAATDTVTATQTTHVLGASSASFAPLR